MKLGTTRHLFINYSFYHIGTLVLVWFLFIFKF